MNAIKSNFPFNLISGLSDLIDTRANETPVISINKIDIKSKMFEKRDQPTRNGPEKVPTILRFVK